MEFKSLILHLIVILFYLEFKSFSLLIVILFKIITSHRNSHPKKITIIKFKQQNYSFSTENAMFELIITNPEELSTRQKFKRSDRLLLKYIRLKNGQLSHDKDNISIGPQDAFEVWHEDEAMGESDKPEEEVLSKKEEDEDTEEISKERLRKIIKEFDTSTSWYKANFIIQSRGLEVLPTYTHYNNSRLGLLKQHVHNLNILLHLNIMKKNWPMAYKVFCLLIRIPKVDIRSIWPLGIQILLEQNQGNKDEKFFLWLLSFFSSNKYIYSRDISRKVHTKNAPAWKSGSKSHAPLFVITSLWSLMSKKDYSKVMDSLSELLLEPPYNHEGVFYFLRAMCLICQNTDIVRQMGDEDEASIRKKVLDSNRKIDEDLKRCEELRFTYPKAHVTEQINVIMQKLNMERRVSSDSESEEEVVSAAFQYEEGEEEEEEVEEEIEQKNNDIDEEIDKEDQQNDELAFDFDFE